MIWSFSNNGTFRKCQRQWYFKNHVANARARDPFRREAYVLSKLQSIPAWRGTIVDQVISTYIIPTINRKQPLSRQAILQYAQRLFHNQLEFAQQKRVREPGMTQEKGGIAFAALHPIEYGDEVSKADLSQAWKDIENALNNFLQMDELIAILRQANNLIAQRALSFSFDSISVRTVPDLIVFFRNEPPMIIDWKVHSFAMQNYRLQLASYAVGLTRCKPHKDFPTSVSQYAPTEIRLLEAQLLTRVPRYYTLTDQDVEGVLSFIARSAREMTLVVQSEDDHVLTPFDFSPALDADQCQRCPFRSLCWEQQ